ncbi:cell division protein FtsA [Thermoflavifilum aggregans]|uniref:Cell division protein FtsA n=1 Tax=Thermoflavifilum aggregans TaxID=454188 RepID=A0A2M9CTH1_9BACT|nr:cell division protein FtsA [Thermoflavifilum aggregans]PJJ75193.1 cell division protein FtsA [Thermoflavifilum aggregans]
MSKPSPIIVGLDIGTTKIAVIAGRKNEFGKLEILGFGRADSFGVQHGMVLNIEQTIRAIQEALQRCYASNPDLIIEEVYVGIAGQHIQSLQTRGEMIRTDIESEISKQEIEQLINDQYKTYIPTGDQIIDVIPQEFSVDQFQNITNPVGYSGIKIGASFHIITGNKLAIRNIYRSVEKAGLHVRDLVLQPLASAAAVMCDQDLEAGVAIVDIGGGTTDMAVFYEGVLRQTVVIPYGGENITNDIKNGLGVLRTQAEQMKVQFGSALADEAKSNAYITIPGLRGQQPREISVKNLAHIIQARIQEILDFVMYHLRQIGLDSKYLNGGIILTGGGSQLKHLIQLTEYVTGLSARIGYPNEHLASGHPEELARPMYATCIGLILKGLHDYENHPEAFEANFTRINALKDEQLMQPPTEKAQPSDQQERQASVRNKRLRTFLDNIKSGIIELFRDEEDKTI